MKVLVVGKGGREHALAWKLARSPRVRRLYAAPGSPGMAEVAECLPGYRVDLDLAERPRLEGEIDRLAAFAAREGIDLTVVGPDAALAAGLVDRFAAAGLPAFGPTEAAARIESSKAFSKQLMASVGVPTAAHRSFTGSAEAIAYIRSQGAPIVVKASGLAAGKGAIVCATGQEAVEAVTAIVDGRRFGDAGAEVVVEAFMEGEEVSLFAVCDGERYVNLVPAQDHKAIGEGDTGPNTGGMGAYAPALILSPHMVDRASREIIEPVLAEMRRLGTPYRGVLYCGLMITSEGPKVVEFNSRFGDPEAQVVLPLLRTDLAVLLAAAARGDLGAAGPVEVDTDRAAACVVMASEGYPGPHETGKPITGLESLADSEAVLPFHAGTALEDGGLVTAGGRVLAITAVAGDLPAAVASAYRSVRKVSFEGAYFRRDIGHRALNPPAPPEDPA